MNKKRLLRSDIQPSSSSTCISKKWSDGKNGASFCLSLICHSVLILFGLLIILFQFIQLNWCFKVVERVIYKKIKYNGFL